MLIVRRAQEEDSELLGRLNKMLIEAEGSNNAMSERQLGNRMKAMLAGGWRAVIAEEEAGPIGYCLFSQQELGLGNEREIYIRHFFICEERRGCGIGTRFLRRLQAEYFPADANIAVDSLATNRVAETFWLKVGFAPFSVQYRLQAR